MTAETGGAVRVAITGAAGRMGRTLVRAVQARPECRLVAAVEHDGSPALGADAGVLAGVDALGVAVVADLAAVLPDVDVVIDFTTPEGTRRHAELCAGAGTALVVGTTGLGEDDEAALAAAAATAAVVSAPNFSVGVNLALRLVRLAAEVVGDSADIEIVEMHHRHKVDAPSGTALRMGEVVAEALGRDLDGVAEHGRSGRGDARSRSTIGFHALRGGDVVGDHTVVFASEGERIEITHKASDRMTFAGGAVRAAVWAARQVPGSYGMEAVLGLD